MATIQSIAALSIYNNIARTSDARNFSLLSLSSGKKANIGIADFSVGTLLSSQASSLTIGNINAGQGKSLLETAKGGVDTILDLLDEQKVLAVKAKDTSLTSNELSVLNQEFQALTTEINRIAGVTEFNNKKILDGSISGGVKLTTATGQTSENYTLLSTADYSFSGTTASGNLATSSNFSVLQSSAVGKTAGTSTLSFTYASGLTSDAALTIGGTALAFGNGAGSSAAIATAFVAAANASTDAEVRKFTYKDNGDGTVTVTTADLGDTDNAVVFRVTDNNSGEFSATLGGSDVVAGDLNITSGTGTGGTDRTVAAGDITYDDNLEGKITDIQATLDTSGTKNAVTFTASVNGTTYTSQAINLFGTGGFTGNTKGAIIKANQVITFYDTAGPKDSSNEFTDTAFTLKIGTSDVTASGADETAFLASLNTIAAGFVTQMDANKINQSRSIVLAEDNAIGGDFDITAANSGVFAGIHGFDAVGTNAKGDINFVSDGFGATGGHGQIGPFAFSLATHKLTTTIDGVTYTADLSKTTSDGVSGYISGGSYNSSTHTLTTSGTIIFESSNTDDARQLQIGLGNVTATSIQFNTTALAETLTDNLDTMFGVSGNESLSFQVGADSTNKIAVSLNSIKTTDIYLDDNSVEKTLDISTTAGATTAETVLTNAINNALAIRGNITAGISSFTAAITSNDAIIQSTSSAASVLLNTDYAQETTNLAELTLQLNASMSVLAQEQALRSGILTLLGSS
ncbi:flagellin [Rickettsiales bacterium]|nr:flagellin [Rickettsiales bacterium]